MLRSTSRRAARAASRAVVAGVLVLSAGACSGGGSDADSDDAAPGDGSSETVPGVPTDAAFGKVTGKLRSNHRAPLRRQVTTTFDSWVDAAYVGDAANAFTVFTKGAAALARRDRLMSNGELADRVDSVTATSRKLTIDVLAHDGRPVGVTGRFVLVLELEGQVQRTDRIVGRLLMRRAGDGWQVFGYDVKRGRVA